MSIARPTVNVYDAANPKSAAGTVAMPQLMQSPIRPDIINFVYCKLLNNHRQAHGVKDTAGYTCSAESWGTGRAVARIPRVAGGGTHRSGQGAFGNMCRGGGMFAPLKVWRKWHSHVNLKQRRHAVASAVAATGMTGLVSGRGHAVEGIPELPLVVSNEAQKFTKTSEAVKFLKAIGCTADLDRVKNNKTLRAGRGKVRGRRVTMRKGPLVVYGTDEGIVKSFRNIPGVDLLPVEALNLLQLAPGGVPGRLTIWTKDAFEKVGVVFDKKSGYVPQRHLVANNDLNKLINGPELQAAVRPMVERAKKIRANKNLLTNYATRCRIDPAYKALRKLRLAAIGKKTVKKTKLTMKRKFILEKQ